MKKSISILLCMVLLFGIVSQAFANETLQAEELSTEKAVKPIAYTHDFDGYSNVVGVLNSDGTKTAYLFASTEQVEQIDSLTGLESSSIAPPDAQVRGKIDVEDDGLDSNQINDATVFSGFEEMNFGANTVMVIGNYGVFGNARTYIKFDVSPLDSMGIAYTDILSACLHYKESSEIESGRRAVIQAYLVKDAWGENTITWNNKPDYYNNELLGSTNVGNYDSEYNDIPHRNMLYITKAVMAWLQGLDNHGIMLMEKDDSFNNRFYSSDYELINYRPYLTITYSSVSAYASGHGITNGDYYYIVNKETGKYLTGASTYITQQDFRNDYEQTQQWKFSVNTSAPIFRISLGNRNVSLSSVDSSLGSRVKIATNTSSSNQKWRVYRNWNGTYRFQSWFNSQCSLKVDSSTTNVVQDEYGFDFEHWDEWTLIPVEKGDASFFSFNITDDIDTTYIPTVLETQPTSMCGYTPYFYKNSYAAKGKERLQNSSFFYYSGHGEPGKLNFFNANKVSRGDLVVSNDLMQTSADASIESLGLNSLSSLQLAVLSSCLTGRDPINSTGNTMDENMTGRLYWLGAHSVISHFNKTYGVYDNAWLSSFMSNVLLGKSLRVSKQRADNHIFDDFCDEMYAGINGALMGNLNERHDLGNDDFSPGFTESYALASIDYEYSLSPQLKFSFKRTTQTNDDVYDLSDNDIEPKFTLPRNGLFLGPQSDAETFDVYMDSKGGTYWYYTGTDVLHSYEPYIENLDIGDYVVKQDKALLAANQFLSSVGYDITRYTIKNSNEEAKNYKIEFYLDDNNANTNEKLVFHMQADESDQVYITYFASFNYNGTEGYYEGTN